MSKSVDYFMSLASPYSYMGGRRLPQIIQDTGATFHIKPVTGPKIMAATGAGCLWPSGIPPAWPTAWWNWTAGSIIGLCP